MKIIIGVWIATVYIGELVRGRVVDSNFDILAFRDRYGLYSKVLDVDLV